MRDSVKVTMVLENSNAKHFPASFRSRSQLVNHSVGNPLFQLDKLRAMKIFKKTESYRSQALIASMPEFRDHQQIEVDESSLFDPATLDQKNKKMRHLSRLKKLKE